MSTSSSELTRTVASAAGTASRKVRTDLSRTGEQLVNTVKAFGAHMDVPSEVGSQLDTTKDAIHTTIGQVKQRLDESKNTVQDKMEKVQGQGKNLTNQTWDQIPTPVAGRLTRLATVVRQRPLPTAAATMFTMVIFLLLRRLLRGGK
jgi:gas vesicle protein